MLGFCRNHLLCKKQNSPFYRAPSYTGHFRNNSLYKEQKTMSRKRIDLSGQRFGRLVVLNETDERSSVGAIRWLCRCDCGKTCVVDGALLKRGARKSCGCMHNIGEDGLLGRTFGSLTVVGYAGRKGGNRRWLCRCSCGKTLEAWQPNLLSGHTKSCGCEAPMPGNRHYVGGTCVEMITSKTISRANTSGVRGVYWKASRGKWSAQITFQSKTHYLGLYKTLEEAAAARARAEKQYFQTFLQESGVASACSMEPSGAAE